MRFVPLADAMTTAVGQSKLPGRIDRGSNGRCHQT